MLWRAIHAARPPHVRARCQAADATLMLCYADALLSAPSQRRRASVAAAIRWLIFRWRQPLPASVCATLLGRCHTFMPYC